MRKSCLATTLVIIPLLFCCQIVAGAGQNGDATVHIDLDTAIAGIQTTRTAVIGDVFDVNVVIKHAANLKSFNLVVTFPQSILQIQPDGITKDGFFPYPEVSPTMNPDLVRGITFPEKLFFIKDLSRPGKAQVTGIVMSNDDVVSGEGALFRLKFKVLSTEQADLQFLATDTQILQDNTGARPEAIDDPVVLENANGAAINGPVHPADKNGDHVIRDFELLDYIDLWANGQVEDFDLLDTIDLWAAGHY